MDAENIVARASEHLSVRRAFGAAYEKDGMLIIPVALVAGGGGGGTSTARTRGGDSAARPDGPPAASLSLMRVLARTWTRRRRSRSRR